MLKIFQGLITQPHPAASVQESFPASGLNPPVTDVNPYLLDAGARIWVWEFSTRHLGCLPVGEVASGFGDHRYRVVSMNLLTGQMRLKAVTSVRGPGRSPTMVRLTLASGQSIVTTPGCPVLTISERGQITTVPAVDAELALVPRRIEMCYEVRDNARQFAGILDVCRVDPEAHVEYGWIRPLVTKAWGWDRLEGYPRVGEEVIEELRADIERRARKMNAHKLSKMDCLDCLVKVADNFAQSISLLLTFAILDRVFPVRVTSVETLPGSDAVWGLTIEDNENFLTAEGVYLGQPE
ncbi:MAG: hypothetical protein QMC81_03290 [Thermoanaerobacterales bacterium]|nr:hypothetical protein [Thermoanaerobacterales bacterium]